MPNPVPFTSKAQVDKQETLGRLLGPLESSMQLPHEHASTIRFDHEILKQATWLPKVPECHPLPDSAWILKWLELRFLLNL